MSAGGKVVAGFVGLLMLGGVVSSCGPDEAANSSAAVSIPAAPTAPVAPVAAPPVAPAPAPRAASTVARVIDGDTFELADGQRVRVLGIDSCEMSTPAGADAKGAAVAMVASGTVTLTQEPGVDRDRYGRLLRYVETGSGDFGTLMVGFPHTGVYEGRNDAGADRVAALRAADGDGRVCSGPETTTPAPKPSHDDDDESRRSVPDVDAPTKKRSGNSGHLCGPGERDGDGDGYCGEGK